jgi:hypothetical protein
MPLVDDAKVKALRGLIDQSNTAKSAADVAAADFKAVPGQLAGTGGEEWKALFRGRQDLRPRHPTPSTCLGVLPSDADCPLRQNPLGTDGSARLARFDAFIQQASEARAKKTRDGRGGGLPRAEGGQPEPS